MFFQNRQYFHPISGCFGGNRGFPGETVSKFFAEGRVDLDSKNRISVSSRQSILDSNERGR